MIRDMFTFDGVGRDVVDTSGAISDAATAVARGIQYDSDATLRLLRPSLRSRPISGSSTNTVSISLCTKFAGPSIDQVTRVPPRSGESVYSVVTVETNGLANSSRKVTWRSGFDSTMVMRPVA